ncbi:putative NuA4 histone acetyltransferase complex component Yng2 [Candida maltosa Xu316]|uniref:Chromatin modification-related protein n=1 Tax=Candida maltosa (strain Xu316) TaxID=1245528 RepID=M3HTU0_CANMX|nr:putative NuA4 histone acetyltransferase complex component Yng2 [Candida maltosa Xu316]
MEIKNKDAQVAEARKRYQARDNQIHKFIRQNGTLVKHPKEEQMCAKIEEDMKLAQSLQKEKIVLANTALFLISKHLSYFETDIAKLERDDLLPPLEETVDLTDTMKDDYGMFNGLSDSSSRTPTPRNGLSVTPVAESIKKGGQKRRLTMKTSATSVMPSSSTSRQLKRLRSEEIEEPSPFDGGSLALNGGENMGHVENSGPNGDDADNNLYCFCQRVSFGEMIGCDNDDCKYEWFHWSCVGITSPPKDDEIWYCPDCAPKMEKRKKKRKN